MTRTPARCAPRRIAAPMNTGVPRATFKNPRRLQRVKRFGQFITENFSSKLKLHPVRKKNTCGTPCMGFFVLCPSVSASCPAVLLESDCIWREKSPGVKYSRGAQNQSAVDAKRCRGFEVNTCLRRSGGFLRVVRAFPLALDRVLLCARLRLLLPCEGAGRASRTRGQQQLSCAAGANCWFSGSSLSP